MEMIDCPECEKRISEKAKQCPNCGFEITSGVLRDAKESTKEKDKNMMVGAGVGAAVGVGLVAVTVATGGAILPLTAVLATAFAGGWLGRQTNKKK